MNADIILFGIAAALLVFTAYNMLGWTRLTTRSAPPGALRFSLLIPARNEEANLARLLPTLTETSKNLFEILVYDDHSNDGTAEQVRQAARKDPCIRLVAPRDLPPGWSGKAFACSVLAEEARGDWLLFLDADVRIQQGAVDRMLAEVDARGVTLLSCWPALDRQGFWEHAFMPMLNFVVFTLFPAPLSLRDNRPSLGLAHGACILVQTAAYRAMGGHTVVRGELFEDTALARAWRHAGLRGVCLDGSGNVAVRMYDSLRGIWDGFQKNIYPAFRRETSFWLFVAFHATAFLLPFLAAAVLAFQGLFPWPVWAAVTAILGIRLLLTLRFGGPLWTVLMQPLGELALLALALTSWTKCRFGGGIAWKGRCYKGRVA